MRAVSDDDLDAFRSVLGALEAGWNAGDGPAFGAVMAEDADFVTIRADHLRGRDAIVASHRHIFSTIYAGSRNRITLDAARFLGENVALVHARSILEAPTGPLAGRHAAMFSAVLLRATDTWQITSFHIVLDPSATA